MYNKNDDNDSSYNSKIILKKLSKINKILLERVYNESLSKCDKNNLQKLSKLLAKSLKNDACLKEPLITKEIKNLESDHSFLINLNSKIKNQRSLSRKIFNDAILKSVSPERASMDIYDIIRYTLIITDDKYVEYVQNSLDKLLEHGYEIIPGKFKNRWGRETYQGINVGLISPYNIKIEIQFHTKDSYHTKEHLNHIYYEIYRNPFICSEIRTIAKNIMKQNQSTVRIPKDAIGYKYNQDKEKIYIKK